MASGAQLTEIDATFPSLKPEIGLRPIWHEKAECIRAHLLIAGLADHAVQQLLLPLASARYRDSWTTIRNQFSTWGSLRSTLLSTAGKRIERRQDSRPDEAAAAKTRAAGVAPGLHRVRTRTTFN